MTQQHNSQAVTDGIARAGIAEAHADALSAAVWSGFADDLLERWVEDAGDIKWLAESALLYAIGCGLPSPPDNRAWGAVIARAARRGLIEGVGYKPDRYGSPKRLWRTVV